MRGIAIRTGEMGMLVQLSENYWAAALPKLDDSDVQEGETEIAIFRRGQPDADSFIAGSVVKVLADEDRKVLIFKEEKGKVVGSNVYSGKNLGRYTMDGSQYP